MAETLDKKKYNTTDLDPEKAFDRHIFHRDMFAHYLRWSHIFKVSRVGETVADFGCGNGNLLEVLYRNRLKQAKYVGIDIRDNAKPKLKELPWAEFIVEDLVNPQNGTDFSAIQASKVCSFEVIEHVGKQNVDIFLQNFKACGVDDATYYLSTPNYDERVGAAGNHTYDSGDDRGIAVQEFTYQELHDAFIRNGFTIQKTYGTFASIRDYKELLTGWKLEMYNNLKEYFDVNILSNLMAPFFPEQSRNTLWILTKNQ